MGVHVSPLPITPCHLPPHPIPLGCLSVPALSTLFHALNLDWSSILYMVIYIFQFYFLQSSHPHLLPQSPKVCSIHLCLFVLHIGLSLPALFKIARTRKQPRCPLADEWIRKLWYLYTMNITQSLKRTFESVLMRWMKLEPIIQSEVSQKDKDHYSILTHIYGI